MVEYLFYTQKVVSSTLTFPNNILSSNLEKIKRRLDEWFISFVLNANKENCLSAVRIGYLLILNEKRNLFLEEYIDLHLYKKCINLMKKVICNYLNI